VYADRRPSLVQQGLDIGISQRSKLVDKADAGVELRIASQALFNAWHTDQNHSNPALIKNAPCLLQSGDLEPVGFVDDQQRGRIGDPPFLIPSHDAVA